MAMRQASLASQAADEDRPRRGAGGGRLRRSGAAADAPAKPNHEVKEPHYGDALFHFFQDHHFTSVTTLMASQHFGRVSHHDEESRSCAAACCCRTACTKDGADLRAG